MKINIETPNLIADVRLLDLAKRKLLEPEQFYDKIFLSDVFFKVVRIRGKQSKMAEI